MKHVFLLAYFLLKLIPKRRCLIESNVLVQLRYLVSFQETHVFYLTNTLSQLFLTSKLLASQIC